MVRQLHLCVRFSAGRNPATYQAKQVFSCTDMTNFLVQHLVGCDASQPLGVTSPMSATFWCQQLDYTPLGTSCAPEGDVSVNPSMLVLLSQCLLLTDIGTMLRVFYLAKANTIQSRRNCLAGEGKRRLE